jgi:hypothetical protein
MYHRLPYVSRGIFVRLDIIYHRLSYVSGGYTPYIPVERHNESIIEPLIQLYSLTE